MTPGSKRLEQHRMEERIRIILVERGREGREKSIGRIKTPTRELWGVGVGEAGKRVRKGKKKGGRK